MKRADINRQILLVLSRAEASLDEAVLHAQVQARLSRLDYHGLMGALRELEEGGYVMRFAHATGDRWAITDRGNLEINQ